MTPTDRLLHDARAPLATLSVEIENLRAVERHLRTSDLASASRVAASISNLEEMLKRAMGQLETIGQQLRDAVPDSAAPVASQPTVLVVDDQVALCRALSRRLGKENHVEVAHDVASAKAKIPQLPLGSVILCDMNLPDGTVTDVLAILDAQRPDLRVVGMTGGSIEATTRAQWPEVSWVRKPDDMARIGWYVERARAT